MSFKEFLAEEAVSTARTEHVEDHVLSGSAEGYKKTVESLNGVLAKIMGEPTTVKLGVDYDGPSFKFGRDLKGNLEIQAPNIDMYHKLRKYLPDVAPPKGAYEGHFMYSEDGLGEDPRSYFFAPHNNSQDAVYGFKQTEDEGKKIRRSKIGIVIKKKWDKMGSEVLYPSTADFKKTADVHIFNSEYPIAKTNRNDTFQQEYLDHMNKAETHHIKGKEDMYSSAGPLVNHLRSYVDETSANDEKPTALGFKAYMKRRYQDKLDGAKSNTDKLNVREFLMRNLDHVDDHHENFENLLSIFYHVQKAKDTLLSHLNAHLPHEKYVKGQKVEGDQFLVLKDGSASKMVSRLRKNK